MMNTVEIKRGDIFIAKLDSKNGSEQCGTRPVLIIQNNIGNTFSPTTIICPLTTKIKPKLPTHLYLDNTKSNLKKNSTILCEQIMVIDKQKLLYKIGCITSAVILAQLNAALMASIGLT